MGAYYSTKQAWYVYSRDLISDSWNKEPIYQSNKKEMGKFKHLVYKFSLQTDNTDKKNKSIYLYNGSTRFAKAELIRPESDNFYKLEMEFRTPELATEWDLQDEVILSQRLLWREMEFNKKYVALPELCKYKRRWQLIKSLDIDNITVPKLSITEYLRYVQTDDKSDVV